jgi:hypothetical protein
MAKNKKERKLDESVFFQEPKNKNNEECESDEIFYEPDDEIKGYTYYIEVYLANK